uniref:FH2 domain-containing protein n=1 Tax=Timema tahoe TaxID=61484 RepID=A0A7R9FJ10_9NEOP|nr:unnamed protein product [Timema tahoe]
MDDRRKQEDLPPIAQMKRSGTAKFGTTSLLKPVVSSAQAEHIRPIHHKEEFSARTSELRPQLTSLVDICDDLMHNAALRDFLALILQLGNYLNAGSYAGNAVGFRLNALPKLLDTRANKPRFTFLHYIVEEAQKSSKDALSFITELSYLHNVARLSVEGLEEDVRVLVKEIRQLNEKLKVDQHGIYPHFQEFLEVALKEVDDLENLAAKVRESWIKLAIHFCEDPLKFQPEECFKLFSDFFTKIKQTIKSPYASKVLHFKRDLAGYQLVCWTRENEQRHKQEERIAKKEAEKSVSPLRRGSRLSAPVRRTPPRTDEPCLVDQLMQEIRSGTFNLRRNDDVKRFTSPYNEEFLKRPLVVFKRTGDILFFLCSQSLAHYTHTSLAVESDNK